MLLLVLPGCAVTVRESVQPPVIAAENNNKDVYYQILKAHYLSFSGRIEEGMAIFRQCLEDYPSNSELHYQYARFLIDLSYRTTDQMHAKSLITTAREELSKVLEITPGNRTAKNLLVDLYIELGDLAQAIALLEKMLTDDPSNQSIRTDLARLYVHIDAPEKAVGLLQPVVETGDISNYDLLKVFALACAESQNYNKAVEIYNRYLELFPGEFEASYNLALCYYRSGQFLLASEMLERMKSAGQMSLEVAELYTDVLKSQNRLQEAIALLEEIGKNPQFEIGANIEIGQLFLSMGNPEKASQYLILAVTKAPNDRRATFFASVAFNELKQYSDALRMLENNLEDSPVSIASADLAIDILMNLGQTDAAIQIGERMLREKPKDARSYLISSRLYDAVAMKDKSIEILEQGAEMFPDLIELNMALAYHLEQSGDWRRAVEIAEKLHSSNSDSPELSNFIGYVLADRNVDLERALELIRSALAIEPENPAFIDSLAWVYFRMGNIGEAYTEIHRAVKALPDDPVVIEHLVMICLANGDVTEAKTVLDDALKRFPDNGRIKALAESMSKISDDQAE